MFIKELALLGSIKADWNITSYQDLLINYGGTEKKIAFLSNAMSDLEKLATEIASLSEKSEYKLKVVNSDKVNVLIGKIDKFVSQYEEIKRYRVSDAKIFESNAALSSAYFNLTRYSNAFNTIIGAAPTYKEAYNFYVKFTKLGAYDENKIHSFYTLISKEYKASYTGYLPDNCLAIIKSVNGVYNDRVAAEAFYNRAQGYVGNYSFCLSTYDNFSRSIEEWDEIVSLGKVLLRDFDSLRKNNKSVLVGNCEKEYINTIKNIVTAAENLSIKTQNYLNQISNKGRSIERFAALFRNIWLVIMGSIALYSIIEKVIYEFQGEKQAIFAIIVGLLSGIFTAAMRTIAFCGFGVAWWPEMFTPFEWFENSALYLNILIIALGLLVIIMAKVRDGYSVYDSDESHNESYIGMFLVASNIVVLLVRIIYVATSTCITNWTADAGFIGTIIATPIAFVIGVIAGIFRALLLIVGGGYWGESWESWYLEAGIDGKTLNTALYNLIVALIIVFLIDVFVGKNDNKFSSLLKKNKN